MDSSPQVRDAAIDLIGKYLVLSPELVEDYYPQIANRIAVRITVNASEARLNIHFTGHWIGCSKTSY
jgi:hypothetical protein